MKTTRRELRRLIKEAISNLAGKTLYVFDFDETLAETDSRVIITRKGQKGEYLTSAEYREYKKLKDKKLVEPGRENHKTFKRVKSGTMIHPVYNIYMSLLQSGEDVVIITARPPEAEPTITSFLQSNQIINPDIYCTRGSMNKPAVLINLLSQKHFNKVVVYEDDINNIKMLEKVTNDLGINYEGFLVTKESGNNFSILRV